MSNGENILKSIGIKLDPHVGKLKIQNQHFSQKNSPIFQLLIRPFLTPVRM